MMHVLVFVNGKKSLTSLTCKFLLVLAKRHLWGTPGLCDVKHNDDEVQKP